MVLNSIRVSCPGTCGEWIQGAKEGTPFLVSAPINRYSEVKIERLTQNSWSLPTKKVKVKKVLDIIKRQTELAFGGRVSFLQELPEGKGMASSTADIVAFTGAVLTLHEAKIEPLMLAKLALAVEPSDSVMFSQLTEMDHIHGSYVKPLGKAVAAKFLTLDVGGEVNTQMFNSRHELKAHLVKNELNIKKAFRLIFEGIEQNDLEKMAAGSTISARCNLEINPKPIFEDLLKWTRQKGGFGIITAHSGTLIAGVFPIEASFENLIHEAKERFYPFKIEELQSVDGGIRVERREDTNAWGQFALGNGKIRKR